MIGEKHHPIALPKMVVLILFPDRFQSKWVIVRRLVRSGRIAIDVLNSPWVHFGFSRCRSRWVAPLVRLV